MRRGALFDEPTRRLFEVALGADLSRVRLHAGRGSALLTRLLGASAVTLGRHICLGPVAASECARCTALGLEVLAHELVHVRQIDRQGLTTFLVRYLFDYLRGRRRGLSHDQAYLAIDAELECATAARRFRNILEGEPTVGLALGRGEAVDALLAARFAACLTAPIEHT